VTKREQQQRLIDIFVNAIYVFDDHAVITFNYKDGTKTISLKEVEAAGVGSSLSGCGAPKKSFHHAGFRWLKDFLFCLKMALGQQKGQQLAKKTV